MKLTKVETEDGKKWRIDYRPTKEGDIHILQGYSGAVAHVCNQPGYHDHLEAVMIEIEEFEVSSHEVKTLEIDSSLISSIYEIPQDVTPPDPYTEGKEFELKIKPGEINVTNTKINHKCPKCDYDESKSELKPLKYKKFNNHFTGCPICGCELSVEKFEEDFNYSLIYNPIYNDILAHATITPTSKRAEFWSACETYNKVYDFLKSKGFQGDFLDFDFGSSTDGKKIIIDNNVEDFMLWAKAEGIDYREMDGYKDYIKRVRSNPETDVAETKFSTANGEVVWPSPNPKETTTFKIFFEGSGDKEYKLWASHDFLTAEDSYIKKIIFGNFEGADGLEWMTSADSMYLVIHKFENSISVYENPLDKAIREADLLYNKAVRSRLQPDEDGNITWTSPFMFSDKPDPLEITDLKFDWVFPTPSSSEPVKPSVCIALAHEDGKFPQRQKDGDAGLDLFLRDCKGEPSPTGAWTIRPGHRKKFLVGVKTEFPKDMVAYIKPRSGLAANHGIDVLAGTIDSNFRGELCVCLINHGHQSYTFEKGERIAQIVFHQIVRDVVEVEFLSDSDRGESGFGESGK